MDFSKSIVLILAIFLNLSLGFERDLTINIDPGKSDCFYQQATKGQVIDVEFQVIDGTRGSLDVGFLLSGPENRVLVALGRRQSGIARTEAPVTGDYRFCFDNTHSTISSKTVYFDILIDDDDSDENSDKTADENDSNADGYGEDLTDVAERVANHLIKVRRLQEAVAARSSRDDHAAARSLSRVTIYSASNAAAVLTIGILQVILVRSLFDETSRIHGIWNKLPLSKS